MSVQAVLYQRDSIVFSLEICHVNCSNCRNMPTKTRTCPISNVLSMHDTKIFSVIHSKICEQLKKVLQYNSSPLLNFKKFTDKYIRHYLFIIIIIIIN